MPVSKYKKKSKSKSLRQKQKQKQKQTVNIYLAKQPKTIRKGQTSRSSGARPFMGLLNITPQLNPTADLGNVVNTIISRLSPPAVEKPIQRAEQFRVGRGASVPIQQPTGDMMRPIVYTQEPEVERIVTTPSLTSPARSSRHQDVTMPLNPFDAFDVNYQRGETSPASSSGTIVPFGHTDRGQLEDAIINIGGMNIPLSRQSSPLIEPREETPQNIEEIVERESVDTYTESMTEGLRDVAKKRGQGINLFKGPKRLLPSDFRAEGGQGFALVYDQPTTNPVLGQYRGSLNVTGAAVREQLIKGVEQATDKPYESMTEEEVKRIIEEAPIFF